MILCIDIGNTNIKYAIFDGKELKISFRVETAHKKTSDEYGSQLIDMMRVRSSDPASIKGGILSSVVPSLDYTILHMCQAYLAITPLMLAPGLKTGLNIRVENAKEVGADRIVNSVSAWQKYGNGHAMIVVDFGTATTFNALDETGGFLGGVVAPGIKGSLDSLVNGTAKLPRVEIEAPKYVIGKNTVTNMQAGIVFGFAGLVDYIVKKMKKELHDPETVVVA
ncbi:MAG: type III pantothenate kinase, partial [Christensenellaceae bacterium]